MPDIKLSEVSCGDIHHAGLTKDLNLSNILEFVSAQRCHCELYQFCQAVFRKT